MKKRGVSEVISTILMILIIIASISILVFIILPFISDNLEKSKIKSDLSLVSFDINNIGFEKPLHEFSVIADDDNGVHYSSKKYVYSSYLSGELNQANDKGEIIIGDTQFNNKFNVNYDLNQNQIKDPVDNFKGKIDELRIWWGNEFNSKDINVHYRTNLEKISDKEWNLLINPY